MTDHQIAFGAMLDAMQRLMSAGFIVSYNDRGPGRGVLRYVVSADRPGSDRRFAVGPTISHATIRLADRLAPGRR